MRPHGCCTIKALTPCRLGILFAAARSRAPTKRLALTGADASGLDVPAGCWKRPSASLSSLLWRAPLGRALLPGGPACVLAPGRMLALGWPRVPSTDALRLCSPEFPCALRRRLGLANGGTREQCEGCGGAIDPHGHHRTACGRTGRNYARHKCVVAAWRQCSKKPGATCQTEPWSG